MFFGQVVLSDSGLQLLFLEVWPILFNHNYTTIIFLNQLYFRIMSSRAWVFWIIYLQEFVFRDCFWTRKLWLLVEYLNFVRWICNWTWSFLIFIQWPSVGSTKGMRSTGSEVWTVEKVSLTSWESRNVFFCTLNLVNESQSFLGCCWWPWGSWLKI